MTLESVSVSSPPGDQSLSSKDQIPLVVDLDGTLTRTDLLYESYFSSMTRGIGHHFSVIRSLIRGKAQIKAYLSTGSAIDYTTLPYNADVLELIRTAKSQGKKVYLATASDRSHAEKVAQHVGLFDGVFASDGVNNLTGRAKAIALVEAFGEGGFDYVGDRTADIPIWAHARKAFIVSNSAGLVRKAQNLKVPVETLPNPRVTLKDWRKALRVHQYAKNALVFVALLTSHAYSPHAFLAALAAFAAFSLCASSVYLLNDLVDLADDRKHPTKRNRPFASGTIPLIYAIFVIPALLAGAFAIAFFVSIPLTGALAAYFLLTLTYSFSFKRKLIVDVVTLATLYTVRVVAGAIAIAVTPSEWLLAFSMLIFTCLALVKRYIELAMRIDRELPDPTSRNYRLVDLPIVGALAAASGLNAVTIFALYVSSFAVQGLYRRPELLWLICPVLLYWLSRIVVLAHRRAIDDDPIIFAIRDRNSLVCGVCIFAIVLAAS
jgi:4-hydroxybenzoate polyprenyltransferase/phosphoglycolate phosphatase-like HAD superfamily hydrolase